MGACDQTSSKSENKQPVSHNSTVGKRNIITASPNPFVNRVTLSFEAAQSGPVNISVYDLNGKLVANLFNGVAKKGNIQKVNFDAGSFPAGIYISRLQTASGFTEQRIIRSR